MAIEEFKLVDGQPLANRARYWAHRRMQELNLSMTQVEFETVSRSTVFKFITGKSDITLEKFGGLCSLLGCEPLDLLRPLPGERRRA